jgi:hypothetical protein
VFGARFTVDDRVDALRMSYRFRSPGGSGEMTVARPQGGGIGRDVPVRRTLIPCEEDVERIRVPLHGRRGKFVFRLQVEPSPESPRLDVRLLELVTETNRPASGDHHPR